MTAPRSDHYVYHHLDGDGVVAYVGRGVWYRCLDYKGRSDAHAEFIARRFAECGIEFVLIVARSLTYKEACRIEAAHIRALHPQFNKQMNGAANAGRGQANHNSRLTNTEADQLRREFQTSGLSMHEFHQRFLKDHFGWSSSWKLLSGRSYAGAST